MQLSHPNRSLADILKPSEQILASVRVNECFGMRSQKIGNQDGWRQRSVWPDMQIVKSRPENGTVVVKMIPKQVSPVAMDFGRA
jgi:hypothetical protein